MLKSIFTLITFLISISAFSQIASNKYVIDYIEIKNEANEINYIESTNGKTINKKLVDNDGLSTLYVLMRNQSHEDLAKSLKEKPRMRYLARSSFERVIKEYESTLNLLTDMGKQKSEVYSLVSEALGYLKDLDPNWNDLDKEDFNELKQLVYKIKGLHEYVFEGKKGTKLDDIFEPECKCLGSYQMILSNNLYIDIQENSDINNKGNKSSQQ